MNAISNQKISGKAIIAAAIIAVFPGLAMAQSDRGEGTSPINLSAGDVGKIPNCSFSGYDPEEQLKQGHNLLAGTYTIFITANGKCEITWKGELNNFTPKPEQTLGKYEIVINPMAKNPKTNELIGGLNEEGAENITDNGNGVIEHGGDVHVADAPLVEAAEAKNSEHGTTNQKKGAGNNLAPENKELLPIQSATPNAFEDNVPTSETMARDNVENENKLTKTPLTENDVISNELKEDISMLSEKNLALSEEVERIIQDLEDEKNGRRAEKKALDEKIKEINGKVASVSDKLDLVKSDSNARAEALEKELKALENAIAEKKTAIENIIAEQKKLHGEMQKQTAAAGLAESAIAKMGDRIQVLDEAIVALSDADSRAQKQIEAANARGEQNTKAIADINNTTTVMTRVINSTSDKLDEATNNIAEIKKQVDEENKKNQKRDKGLANSLNELGGEVSSLKMDGRKTKETLSEIKKAITISGETMTELNTKLDLQHKEARALIDQNKKLIDALTERLNGVGHLSETIETMQESIASLEKKIKKIEKEIKDHSWYTPDFPVLVSPKR